MQTVLKGFGSDYVVIGVFNSVDECEEFSIKFRKLVEEKPLNIICAVSELIKNAKLRPASWSANFTEYNYCSKIQLEKNANSKNKSW